VFTGLIADLGRVAAVEATTEGVRLRVMTGLAPELGDGDSVAVDGVCLTATTVGEGGFAADVMHETLRSTALGEVGEGSRVNLELPLRATDRLGGHIVQGHVDALGRVIELAEDGFARLVTIAAEPGLLRYVVAKGSVAVSGVSLTVASVGAGSLTVSLIPETLQRTTLGTARPGAPVNLEVDIVAKYLEKLAT